MRGTVVLLCVSIVGAATDIADAAEKHPGLTLLYNLPQHSSLRVDCNLLTDGKLLCNFSQVSVRNFTTDEDLKKRLNGIKDELKNPIPAKECSTMRAVLKSVQTKTPPKGGDVSKFNTFLSSVKDRELKDMVATWEALANYCESPSAETLRIAILTEHDQKKRTCNVAVNNWQESFTFNFQSRKWTSVDQPFGPCGAVLISTLERDSTSDFDFWIYKSKKIVTNKGGQALGTFDCKWLDETEQIYDWKNKDLYVGCDYVKFSPM